MKTHVMQFLDSESATTKNIISTYLYINLLVYDFLISITWFVQKGKNSPFSKYRRGNYNRVPCYPTSGPHHSPSLLLPLSDHYSQEGAFVWCTPWYSLHHGLYLAPLDDEAKCPSHRRLYLAPLSGVTRSIPPQALSQLGNLDLKEILSTIF